MNPVDVITKLLSVNPGAAKFILGGLGVFAAAAIVLSWQIDTAEAGRIAIFILGFAALVVIGSNFPGRISRMAAWLLFGLFSVFAILFSTQFLCSSCLSPPVPNAGCMISPLAKGCGVSLTPTQVAEIETPETEVPPSEPQSDVDVQSQAEDAPVIETLVPQATTTPERRETVSALTAADIADALESRPQLTRGLGPTRDMASSSIVYIHFAGSLTRELIIGVADQLVAAGWRVEGANNGGERLVSAYGLNEVRFFNKADEDAARVLANEISRMRLTGKNVAIRDLSDAGYSAAEGHLEVWISN